MELTGDNLLCAMRAAGFSIPVNAVPHVNVPGGGDWSNMKLEIDADCPLIISWEVAELS
jgi:hypothetical protein